jgi:hypothetical protein
MQRTDERCQDETHAPQQDSECLTAFGSPHLVTNACAAGPGKREARQSHGRREALERLRCPDSDPRSTVERVHVVIACDPVGAWSLAMLRPTSRDLTLRAMRGVLPYAPRLLEGSTSTILQTPKSFN